MFEADSSFEGFVRRIEPRLHDALSAALGNYEGREATADALAYAWEHWPRIREMENPGGYLYVRGRHRGRQRVERQPLALIPADDVTTPWFEPGLPPALVSLPTQQRVVVMLLYCFEWTMSEVAGFLEISKSSVQTHAERGMARLRDQMGVRA
ncbi:MAG: RNA polymerase sigma factor [Acidimicrobiales bacterium]